MTDEPPKKKKKGVTIEELMNQEQWDDVRKRLTRISSPERAGELLYHSADNPNVPKDIFRLLFKVLKGNRTYEIDPDRMSCCTCVDRLFWRYVCNFRARSQRIRYGKSFEEVCSRQCLSSLHIFVNQFVKICGRLCAKHCRSVICYMWYDRMLDHIAPMTRSYGGRGLRCSEERENELISVSSMEDLQSNDELFSFWRKTELIVKATRQKGPLVHTMIKTRFPLVIVWMAIKLYPDQIKERDRYGRIPLHWACVMNDDDTEEGFAAHLFRTGILHRVAGGRPVDLILEAFPEGSRYADAQGFLPLVMLLHVEYRSWTFNNWTQRCALALVREAPEALVTRNAENRMLPFMTAACIHDENTTKAGNKEQEKRMLKRKLDMTYELLRQDPSVVSLGVRESLREEYLQRKLARETGNTQRLEKELEEQKNKMQRLEKELEEWKTRCNSQQDDGQHELN